MNSFQGSDHLRIDGSEAPSVSIAALEQLINRYSLTTSANSGTTVARSGLRHYQLEVIADIANVWRLCTRRIHVGEDWEKSTSLLNEDQNCDIPSLAVKHVYGSRHPAALFHQMNKHAVWGPLNV